ncbi:MAG: DUF4276 family protein [Phycisphaerales bacterium]|nr:DUF4276 family protein [Phycisphaerales bacterium]
MKRLNLTVEGQTEQAFATSVLGPHLERFGVFVGKPRLTGLHARRKGRIPTGGLLNTFRHSLGDIRRWMREDRSDDVRFSVMVDLYSLPRDFPGYDEAMSLSDPHDQAARLGESLSKELQDPRFIPYVQVHEFEALVLADVSCLAGWFEDADKRIQDLASECSAFATPEHINHGRDSHPKARIKRYFSDYDENVDGPALVGQVGVSAIRQRCPHFSEWLTKLEQLDA